jgi:glycosyltransferase involved in cell wall biosynthesis
VPAVDGVEPIFLPIPFDAPLRWIPGWSNWTIRAGCRARRSIARFARGDAARRPDVMFVHTQVPAVLLGRWMRRIPTVVSIDATPEQYDSLGEFYAHDRSPEAVERLKHRINRRCFERATHLVTWSQWAREGLIEQYGIEPERITVIAPGVDTDTWRPPVHRRAIGEPVRILFVGGDLRRKGGDHLIEAVRQLRRDPEVPAIELHIATPSAVAHELGVFHHAGLTANSPELIALYHEADIFCLPTLGDCLPMVLAEAAASGLPLVSTDVGAIREIVQPRRTGELVAPGDVEQLTAALRLLVLQPDLRRQYGRAARSFAERHHSAADNAARVVSILEHHAVVGHGA